MRNLKIAVIGAGSTYTPELIEGFINRKESLHIESLYLMDIDSEKLNVVGSLVKRMLKKISMDVTVVLTADLEKAIQGAHYVLTQLRVGRLDARIRDEKIPLKYDLLGQETTGAGGFMNGMRTIPVIMNIVKTMEKLAPDAWLINFTNPVSIITETVLGNSEIKAIGLCNVPISLQKDIRQMLPKGMDKFDFDYVGLNHLSWITAVYADEKNILPELLDDKIEVTAMKNIYEIKFDKSLLKATNAIPSTYLSYFYFREEQIKHCKEKEKTRGELCKEIEEKLMDMYRKPDLEEKPSLLEERGGAYYSTAAVTLIDSIENDKNEMHIVNVKNDGAYDFMDKDDVVEAKCIINRSGATPIKVNNFDNYYIIGLMKAVKAYEKLAVKAGLKGDYNAALTALLVHPLVGDYNKSKMLLDEMLEANKEFLPQFFHEEIK